MDGVLIARGPGIREGVELPAQQISDVAATVLYRMGHTVPARLDSRVITDMLEDDWLAAHPVRYTEEEQPGVGKPVAGDGYSSEEEALIEERLGGLGYL